MIESSFCMLSGVSLKTERRLRQGAADRRDSDPISDRASTVAVANRDAIVIVLSRPDDPLYFSHEGRSMRVWSP